MTDKEILQGIDRLDAELPFDEICVGGKDNWHDIDVHELLYEVRERIKWHYPSKGEYPPDDVRVLVRLPRAENWYECGSYDAEYKTWFFESFNWDEDVVAWQYII